MAELTAIFSPLTALIVGTQHKIEVEFSHGVSSLAAEDFSDSTGASVDSVTPQTDPVSTRNYDITFTPIEPSYTLRLTANSVTIISGDTLTGPTTPITLSGTAILHPERIPIESPETYDPELSEAIKEAYASVPDNQILLETLEFIHNTFYYTSDVLSPDYYNRNDEGYYLPYLENTEYPFNVLDVNSPLPESEFLLLLENAGNDEPAKTKIRNKYRKRTSIKVVNDRHNLDAVILHGVDSAGAAIKEDVTFLRFAFELKLPETDDSVSKEFIIKMDNVAGIIGEHIEVIKEASKSVSVVYRPYLVDSENVGTSQTIGDPPEPQMDPPYVFVLRSVTVTPYQIEAKCTFNVDFTNTPFPNRYYTLEQFPGLS